MSTLQITPIAIDTKSDSSSGNACQSSDSDLSVLNQHIDFIDNPEFHQRSDEHKSDYESVLQSGRSTTVPSGLPPHLQQICAVELLSHDEEMLLFREMNYLKFRAHQLQEEYKSDKPHPEQIQRLKSLLAGASAIRDHLIQANTRLVISVVKKFADTKQVFDDMLSDGLVTLMHAVEKFDYDRGFRFSTYAYRSIARHIYRTIKSTTREESRLVRDAEEWAFSEQQESASSMSDQEWSNLSSLTSKLVRNLDRREQFIIRSRYALGAHRKKRTFQFLADKLGVSKERARQLERRAMEKLQKMAAEFDLDEFTGAVQTV